MNDLISRQAVEDLIMETDPWWSEGMTAAIFWGIKRMPTIDPVKHGKWTVIPKRCENQTFDECKCSVCGDVEYFNFGWKKFSYCPNCGAKMDKEDEEDGKR